MINLWIVVAINTGFFWAGYEYKRRDFQRQADALENMEWSKVTSIEHVENNEIIRFERVGVFPVQPKDEEQ